MEPAAWDRSVVLTDASSPLEWSAAEQERIRASLRINGMAVIRNFMTGERVERLRREAEMACEFGFGVGKGMRIDPVRSGGSLSFRYPFLCSRGAVEVATNESLLQMLERHLGPQPIIHNAQFQVSLPLDSRKLDYHIDCGSVKAINPRRKFADFRLRTIVYLTDVENGGFSYILGSRAKALEHFLPLPYDDLFNPQHIPTESDRHITVQEPAGTLIIFDAHGLHRPEVPKTPRCVLNTWFAKKDFSGNLPPTPFNLSAVPEDRRHRLHVFDSERGGCSIEAYHERVVERRPSVLARTMRLLPGFVKPKKAVNLAYHE